MAPFANRVDELTPGKRALLERLLDARRSLPAAGAAAPVAQRTLRHDSTRDLTAKDACRQFYDVVTEQLDASPFGGVSFFLNYGYVPNLDPQCAAVSLPDAMLNKNSIRLVLELLEDCVGPASRVLDVGCGRGGTISVIQRFFGARRLVGLDLSGAAVSFCARTHAAATTAFLQGDAERLPFAAEAFEVVTNIESSSCYPDRVAFYREVYRLLAPEGRFLYADCLPAEQFALALVELRRIGFAVERERDITSNVLASCDQIAAMRLGAYAGGNDAGAMRDFLGAPGSQYYEEMRAKRWLYRICKLRKGTGAAAAPVTP